MGQREGWEGRSLWFRVFTFFSPLFFKKSDSCIGGVFVCFFVFVFFLGGGGCP